MAPLGSADKITLVCYVTSTHKLIRLNTVNLGPVIMKLTSDTLLPIASEPLNQQ